MSAALARAATAPWVLPAVAWMLTYLLHSSLLLGAAWGAGRLLGRRRLAVQETLWKLALVGGLLTASLQLGLGWRPAAGAWDLGPAAATAPAPAPAAPAAVASVARAPAAAPAVAAASSSPATARLRRAAAAWPFAAVVVWFAVAAVLVLRVGALHARLLRRLHGRWTVSGGAIAALFGRLLDRAGGRRPVRLTGSHRLAVPIAWGVRRPEICLPDRVVQEMSPYHQESILAHELAHVLRRDAAWLTAGRLLEAALFFQPLQRLARRRLQEIAEYRCDDRAVELTGRPLELARCLTEVAAWRLAAVAALPVPSMAAGSELGARVRRLLAGERGDDRTPAWLRPAALAALATVALVAPGFRSAVPAAEIPAAPAAPDPAPAVAPAPPAPATPAAVWEVEAAAPAPAAAPVAAPADAAAADRDELAAAFAELRAESRREGVSLETRLQRELDAVAERVAEGLAALESVPPAGGGEARSGRAERRRDLERALAHLESRTQRLVAALPPDDAPVAGTIDARLADRLRDVVAARMDLERQLAALAVPGAGASERRGERQRLDRLRAERERQRAEIDREAEQARAEAQRERAELEREARREAEQARAESSQDRAELEREARREAAAARDEQARERAELEREIQREVEQARREALRERREAAGELAAEAAHGHGLGAAERAELERQVRERSRERAELERQESAEARDLARERARLEAQLARAAAAAAAADRQLGPGERAERQRLAEEIAARVAADRQRLDAEMAELGAAVAAAREDLERSLAARAAAADGPGTEAGDRAVEAARQRLADSHRRLRHIAEALAAAQAQALEELQRAAQHDGVDHVPCPDADRGQREEAAPPAP